MNIVASFKTKLFRMLLYPSIPGPHAVSPTFRDSIAALEKRLRTLGRFNDNHLPRLNARSSPEVRAISGFGSLILSTRSW